MFFVSSRSCNGFCDPHDLKVMDEVEYGIVRKSGKLSADEITKLPPGSIPTEVRGLMGQAGVRSRLLSFGVCFCTNKDSISYL